MKQIHNHKCKKNHPTAEVESLGSLIERKVAEIVDERIKNILPCIISKVKGASE